MSSSLADAEDPAALGAALRAHLKGGGFPAAKKALSVAAAQGDAAARQAFAQRACEALVTLAAEAKGPRPPPEIHLLSELGPASGCDADLPSALDTAQRLVATAPPFLLGLTSKVLLAWGVPRGEPGLAILRGPTASALAEAVPRGAALGGPAAVAAASVLEVWPTLLGEDEALQVFEAVDDGAHDGLAEGLVVVLPRSVQIAAVQRRRAKHHLKTAARLVHACGLEAEFPDADYEWKSSSLASAAAKGLREPVVGIAFSEPKLRAAAVKALAAMEDCHELAVELADSWAIPVDAALREGVAAERLRRDGQVLRRDPSVLEIMFVDSDDRALAMRDALALESVVGLDAEWVPDGQSPCCLLQLSGASMAFVIDLFALGAGSSALAQALEAIMLGPAVKAGCAGASDLGKIGRDYPLLAACANAAPLHDIQHLHAQRIARDSPGMSEKRARHGVSLCYLAEKYLGRTLDKTLQVSDFSRRPLSEAQLDYAALDAWVPRQIYVMMEAEG